MAIRQGRERALYVNRYLIKSKNISFYNITGSSDIRNKSSCIIFADIYCSVKYVDTDKLASDGASSVNEFAVIEICCTT